MRPSVYDEVTAKDTVVEDRNEVKVVFAGGNVFHIYVDGVDEHETVRGSKKAWERAEAIRLDLDPGYEPPTFDDGETTSTDEENPSGADEQAEFEALAKPETAAAPAPAGKVAPKVAKKYVIGEAEGLINMIPVATVQDMLASHAGRISLLQGSDEARRLARRVRATDGRCAPIFFTKRDMADKSEDPALFDGLYTLAAAINLDMPNICVVILPSDAATKSQGMIGSMMRASLSSESESDDEEVTRRAYSDD